MALFFRDDGFDLTRRQTGFARYRQLLSFYAFHWTKINLITFAGMLPLIAGIWISILASGFVLLVPLSVFGGMIFGPFVAALVDSIMRGLRDAPGNWWKNWRKAFRQNLRASLLPGAALGFFIGLYAFAVYIMTNARGGVSLGTMLVILLSAALVLWFNTLLWPQLVLFELGFVDRVRNALLFTIKHSVRVLVAVVVQLVFLLILLLFAPWTLALMPFIGLWYPIFLAQLRIYGDLNRDLNIEARFIAIEGDPWRKDSYDQDESTDEEG